MAPMKTQKKTRAGYLVSVRLVMAILVSVCGAGMARAGQSVQIGGGTWSTALPDKAPWRTIGARASAMRWEMRIHNFQGNWPDHIFYLGGGIMVGQIYSGAKVQAGGASAYDTVFNNGPVISNCCTGHTDML